LKDWTSFKSRFSWRFPVPHRRVSQARRGLSRGLAGHQHHADLSLVPIKDVCKSPARRPTGPGGAPGRGLVAAAPDGHTPIAPKIPFQCPRCGRTLELAEIWKPIRGHIWPLISLSHLGYPRETFPPASYPIFDHFATLQCAPKLSPALAAQVQVTQSVKGVHFEPSSGDLVSYSPLGINSQACTRSSRPARKSPHRLYTINLIFI